MTPSINKKIALTLSSAIAKGQWDLVDNLLVPDFTYVSDGQLPLNKEQYIYFMRNVLCAAMTDMEMRFLHVIEEDNLVAVLYTNEMTHTGPFMGVPPTGKRVVATGQFIRQVEEGRIVAEWQTTNAMGLLAQLGIHPKPNDQ
ncbi:MAG: SnoaL-like domain-containing protein [Cyclobacteriaceae bacterium]|nr:SnoaL-like domain-containing protein [Cyclobacteriaceae bacterium]